MELINNYLKRFNLTYNNGIKKIGSDLYTHSSNISSLPEIYRKFIEENSLSIGINIFIKASPKKLSVIEVESIEVYEPVIKASKSYELSSGNLTTTEFKNNPPIYHHVWMMMPLNTNLIDIELHKARSVWWKVGLGTGKNISSKVGRLVQWNEMVSKLPPFFTSAPFSQNYSSKLTSINSKKLPAVYTKLQSTELQGKTVFDYGCGRYSNTKDFISSNGGFFIGYDPFNQPHSHNIVALTALNYEKIDYVLCSNVLNVIEEDYVVANICREIIDVVIRSEAKAIVGVYEGDKTGIGKSSGPDRYQRNSTILSYRKFLENHQVQLSCKGPFLIINKRC